MSIAKLLDLSKAIQTGIKNHFKAAQFRDECTISDLGITTFEATVLGLEFEVIVQFKGDRKRGSFRE